MTRITYDFTGGGPYGIDKVVATKEQADHSLPYLLAVALLDGDVMPAQFSAERIQRADVQSLMKKVAVRPNQEYTEVYPRKMPAKITIRLRDGTTYEHEVEEFDRLVAGRVDAPLGHEIKEAVCKLDNIQVKDLMELLKSVRVAQ